MLHSTIWYYLTGHNRGHPQPTDGGILLHPGGLPHRQVPLREVGHGVMVSGNPGPEPSINIGYG